jgi:PilZ domain-containing protein
MTTPYDRDDRRFTFRLALRLPIVVSDKAEDPDWSEPTTTNDISTAGALFNLKREVRIGELLHLSANCRDGAAVDVTAKVIRVAPAEHGPTRVGVLIGDSREDWMRLFVSWVADR